MNRAALIIVLMAAMAAAKDAPAFNHTGSIVPDPTASATGDVYSGFIGRYHYAVICTSSGCSTAAGLRMVIKTDDGRFFTIQPVRFSQAPLKAGDPLSKIPDTFTYYEKPLKGYHPANLMQLCTPGDGGNEACYVETKLQ